MRFWAYMLQCRGGDFHAGHTDDLARRIAQHEIGQIDEFTDDHLPVTLVWSQEFETLIEAKAFERQIKGWSRAKKLALIRGDWGLVSQLAKKKGSPSTGSGQAVVGNPTRPELVEGLSCLVPHPDKPPLAVTAIRARITGITPHWLTLRWSISGSRRIVLPMLAGRRRADDLWRRTCFEMFLQTPGTAAYAELNLSPDEGWAAYDFTGYRAGMTQRSMPRHADCTARVGGDMLIFDAAVPLAGLPPLPWRAGLTAVIEEEGGVLSYWAMAHPPGGPDFHHAACLALTVPAPQCT